MPISAISLQAACENRRKDRRQDRSTKVKGSKRTSLVLTSLHSLEWDKRIGRRIHLRVRDR